ncbi:MAG: cobalamin-dependent protein [Gemmatimonadota bacterium]
MFAIDPGDTAVGRREASEAILARRAELADAVVTLEFQRHPELASRYGAIAREKSLQDVGYHLAYLAQAVAAGNPDLFVDYAGWVKVMLARRGVRSSDLMFHLECLREVLGERLPDAHRVSAYEVMDRALAALPAMPEDLPTLIEPDSPHAALAHQYLQALLRGERHVASRIVLDAVERTMSVQDIYLRIFQRAQYEIGRLWQTNMINVAQEHYCTAATQLIMSQLYPRIFSREKTGGTLVATCVSGDLHELGIRMIADFFELAGWDTYYLGASTPASSVVQTVIDRGADLLAVSATITYHVAQVEALVGVVRATPACNGVRILVGGYPFNLSPDLWKTVGADGYARDAETVIAVAERLTGRPAA